MAKMHGIAVPEEYVLQDAVMAKLKTKSGDDATPEMTNWYPYRKQMTKLVKAKMKNGLTELAALTALLDE